MRNEFSSEKLGSRVPNCTRKEYSEILAVHFITEELKSILKKGL